MDPHPLIYVFAPPEMGLAARFIFQGYFSAIDNYFAGKARRDIWRTNKRRRTR
jgi:hypothetical protein